MSLFVYDVPGRLEVDGNESVRTNWLWLVTAAVDYFEMTVEGQNEFRLGRDGAIHKLVIVWVGSDHLKPEMRLDVKHTVVEPRNAMQKQLYCPPAVSRREVRDGFLIFEQNFVRDCQLQLAALQRIRDSAIRALSAEELHQHVRINTHPHPP